jgi:hypothetical protein
MSGPSVYDVWYWIASRVPFWYAFGAGTGLLVGLLVIDWWERQRRR